MERSLSDYLEHLKDYKEKEKTIAQANLDNSDFKLWVEFRGALDDEMSPFSLLHAFQTENESYYLLGSKATPKELPPEKLKLLIKEAKMRPWDIYSVENKPNIKTLTTAYGLELRCRYKTDPKEKYIEKEKGNWLHFMSLDIWDEDEYLELIKKYPEANIPKHLVYMWVRGMSCLVEAVDTGAIKLANPNIISGATNIRHSEFLKKWDFNVIDQGQKVHKSKRYWIEIEYSKLKSALERSYSLDKVQQLLEWSHNRYENALNNTALYLKEAKHNYPFWHWYFKNLKRFE